MHLDITNKPKELQQGRFLDQAVQFQHTHGIHFWHRDHTRSKEMCCGFVQYGNCYDVTALSLFFDLVGPAGERKRERLLRKKQKKLFYYFLFLLPLQSNGYHHDTGT